MASLLGGGAMNPRAWRNIPPKVKARVFMTLP
jgi:hypothetical protein